MAWVEHIYLIIVTLEVVFLTGTISSHFKKASMMIRNMWSCNGPPMMAMVYLIGMKGIYSPFVLLIYPNLATKLPFGLWLSSMKHLDVSYVDYLVLHPAVRMTTLVPHKTQPSSEDNSYFLKSTQC